MPYEIALGGTGSVTAAGARIKLGLGPDSSPTFTNGTFTGNLSVDGTSTLTGNTTIGGTLGVTGLSTLASLTVTGAFALSGDDVQVSEGGTGSSTAAGARTNLGVAIGSDVQAWDADLDSLAASFGTGFGVRTATSTWALRSLTSSANHLSITNPAGIAGDPVLNLAVGAIQAGTYTPAITAVANVDSASSPDGMYIRIGNIVIVFGTVVIDATAAAGTLTSIGISLPITSNLGASADVSGILGSQGGTTGRVIGDAANDRAQANYLSASAAAGTFHFQFMYEVI